MDNCELFISMDCYEGETLKDKICISRLNIDEALDISLKICEGLKKTHQNNIIHHWQQDIIRHQELKSIAEELLRRN